MSGLLSVLFSINKFVLLAYLFIELRYKLPKSNSLLLLIGKKAQKKLGAYKIMLIPSKNIRPDVKTFVSK